MLSNSINISNGLYYRLIALWVVCEAMLGGIIHGLKLPVSGLLVGSCAVVCICLIAWYIPSRYAIIRATIIVAIFKMILSPQAPFPAYIAVFFQGMLGQLLFFNKKYFRVSCIVFAILALLESGLQRILVLTVIYGNDLWVVVNDFINGITKQKHAYNYSLFLAGAYAFIHLITGVIVGTWVAGIPTRIASWENIPGYVAGSPASRANESGRRKFFKKAWFIIYVLLVALYIQSSFHIGEPLLAAAAPLRILIRSSIIILSWIFIVGPVLKFMLHRWLAKKQGRVKEEIAAIADMLPGMQSIIQSSWEFSSRKQRLARLKLFARSVLVRTISSTGERLYILTGPIGSGKTTSLLNWASKRKDVAGILSPVIKGERIFMDLPSHEEFRMEAIEGEQEVINIGRFVFSREGFEKASKLLHEHTGKTSWLVVDEVGPLELRGEGFHNVVTDLLIKHPGNIILVIREQLVEEVVKSFNINHYTILGELPA
jgi:nucleoside-triphosphatase THEP1